MTAQLTRVTSKRLWAVLPSPCHSEDIARALRQHLGQQRAANSDSQGVVVPLAEKLRRHVDMRI